MNHREDSALGFIVPKCQDFHFSTNPEFPVSRPLSPYCLVRGTVKVDAGLLNPPKIKFWLLFFLEKETGIPLLLHLYSWEANRAQIETPA